MKQERCNLENGAFAGGQLFTDNDFHQHTDHYNFLGYLQNFLMTMLVTPKTEWVKNNKKEWKRHIGYRVYWLVPNKTKFLSAKLLVDKNVKKGVYWNSRNAA